MSKQAEIEKLDRTLKDSEIRLRTLKTNIDTLDREIDTLAVLEQQLEENVKCLKKKNIIAIATEFKKSKEELAKTRAKSIALRNDREQYKKASKDMEDFMAKVQADLDKLNKIGEHNVLQGNFGKKD